MGMIVEFGARAGTTVKKPPPERPCEVTIFPGVRYERQAPADRGDTAETRPSRPRPGRPEGTAR